MFILIREPSRWVSQKYNTKKTLYMYFSLLGHLQELLETLLDVDYGEIWNIVGNTLNGDIW